MRVSDTAEFTVSFNCTIMELKFFNLSCLIASWQIVLIVPLWNWNIYYFLSWQFCYLVLIVPLWNWNIAQLVLGMIAQFNVLIVPLWNWNFSMQTIAYQFVYQVLIVLLWNWNICGHTLTRAESRGFNCTIMELK